MTDEKLKIQIVVDDKGSVSMRKFGDASDRAAKDAKDAFTKAGNATKLFDERVNRSTSSLLKMSTVLTSLAAGYSLTKLAESFLDVGIYADRMSKSLTAALGSAEEAASAQEFLREESERLGLVFKDQIDQFKGIAAAAKGTALEGDRVREIYVAVAEASTALQLSSDDTSGALRALSQMVSKGTVQAEELRGQLGERLPGAFQLAAKAMGVSTRELGKMLEQGQVITDEFLPKFARAMREQYSGAVKESANSVQANLNRISNSWFDLQKTIMESGVMEEVNKQLVEVNKQMKAWLENNEELIRQKVPEYIENVKTALKNIWEIITYDTAIIEYGIVGLAIGGRKGAAITAGFGHMVTWIKNLSAALGLASAGVIEFSDIANANFKELQAIVNKFDSESAAMGKMNQGIKDTGEAAAKSLPPLTVYGKRIQDTGDIADLTAADLERLDNAIQAIALKQARSQFAEAAAGLWAYHDAAIETSLALQGLDLDDMAEETRLVNDVFGEINTALEENASLFENSIFGDGPLQSIQNTMVAVEKFLGVYDKIIKKEEYLIALRKDAKLLPDEKQAEAFKKIKQLEAKYADEAIQSQLGGYRQLFGTLKGMFDENSRARQVMHAAEMAFAVAEIAIQMQKALVSGVEAVLNQGKGEPYSAYARIAAMAAVVASFLSMIGVAFGGGGGGSAAPPESKPPSTVLGADPGTESESIANAFGILIDQGEDQIWALYGLKEEMQDLNQNIMQFVVGMLQGTFSGGGWSGQEYKIPGGYTLGEILSGEGIKGFKRGPMPEWDGSIYDNSDYGVELFKWIMEGFDELGDSALTGLTNVFTKIGSTFVQLAMGLGVDVQKVLDFSIGNIHLDLTGLTESEIQDKVTGYFSRLTDNMAEKLFGHIVGRYQKIGEGMLETATRVVSEKEGVLAGLKMTGQAFEGTAEEAVHFSQALIELAGDFEDLTEDMKDYFDEYMTDAEKLVYITGSLADAYKAIDREMPATRQAFKDLVAGLDRTKEADRRLYVQLLELAGATDAYYDALEQANKAIVDAQRELTGTTESGMLSDINERYGWNITGKSAAFQYIEAFIDATEDEVIAYAKLMGVSTEDLVDDIMWLAEHFGWLGDAFAKLRDQIEGILSGVSGSFGGGNSAAMIMSQITGLQSIPMSEQTGDNLLEMSNKLVQWYNAAVSEAQAAARAEQDTARLWEQVADRVSGLVGQIDDAIRNIETSPLNVSLPREIARDIAVDYEAAYAAAKAGGTAEVQEYLSIAQTHLGTYQEAYKSSLDYQDEYARVMGHMAEIKSKAEAGGYDAAILAELERGNEQISVDLSAIQATFSEFEGWILGALTSLETLDFILSIDWENYDGSVADVLELLLQLVDVYGWEHSVTLGFISDMGAWAAQDVERAIELLGYIQDDAWDDTATLTFIASLSANLLSFTDAEAVLAYIAGEAGWNSQAVITFLENVNMDIFTTLKEQMAAIGYVASTIGWESTAAIDFIARFSDAAMAWADIKQALIDYGASDDTATKTLQALWISTDANEWDWDTFLTNWRLAGGSVWAEKYLKAIYDGDLAGDLNQWSNFVLAFQMAGVDDASAKKILSAVYSATTGQGLPTLWSDFEQAFQNAGYTDETAIKTIQAQYDAQYAAGMDTWAELSAALVSAGVSATAQKTVKGVYTSQGGMTMSQLEQLLSDSGVPESITRNITTDIEGSVSVDLAEMDVWKAQTALLMAIAQNTARAALALSGGSITLADVGVSLGSLSQQIQEWIPGMDIYGVGTNAHVFQWGPWVDFGGGSGGTPSTMTVTQTDRSKLQANAWLQNSPLVKLLGSDGRGISAYSITSLSGKLDNIYNRLGGTLSINGTVELSTWFGQVLARIASNTYGSYQNLAKLNTKFDAGIYSLAGLVQGGVRTDYGLQFDYGGIASGPESGYQATLHGTELVVSQKSTFPATVLSNGASTRQRAEEIALLRELVELQKEEIDTLRVNRSGDSNISVNLDIEKLASVTGKYISERTKRRSLEIRAS